MTGKKPMFVKHLAVTATLGCALIAVSTPASASSCTDLMGAKLAGSLVRNVEEIEAGSTRHMGNRDLKDLPAFCRIVASTGLERQSNITIELWLPSPETWNQKFLGTGNGAFAGAIRYDQLIGGLKHGYAVVNTDMGTFPAAMLGGAGYAAGTGRPEVIADWGYRATHEMTVAASALTEKYYGRKPQQSYFSGCSTGGHQALTEAQRFPNDYDAIIAGAPGHNRTHLHLMFLQTYLKAHETPDSFVPLEKVPMITQALLSSCVGKDGGAPGDKYLTDPTACSWSPRSLLCRPGTQDTSQCLTEGQVTTFEKIYRGGYNPRNHHIFYPGWVKGSEQIFTRGFGKAGEKKAGAADTLVAWVFGSDYDANNFDFDKDITREDKELGPIVNAMSPDLSAFSAHGGKLILFHGWADAVVSPLDTIAYFNRVQEANKDSASFVRLFMAPGMGHCSAGPGGADNFGQGHDPRPGHNADNDLLDALDAWVKQGRAPEQIIATRYDAADKKLAARPLCAYPMRARYRGGNADDPNSFTCVKAPPASFEPAAPEYLR